MQDDTEEIQENLDNTEDTEKYDIGKVDVDAIGTVGAVERTDWWAVVREYLLTVIIIVAVMGFLSLTNTRLAKVNGNSMYPTLKSGDLILMSGIGSYSDGDIIVLDTTTKEGWLDPNAKYIIKRYYAERSENGIYVIGDNLNNSYDSRYVGEFSEDAYMGKVIFNFSQFKLGSLYRKEWLGGI